MSLVQTHRHEYIIRYADAGYCLTPLQGKLPKYGWRETEYELEPNLKNYPGNFGVVLQSDDLVLDIDPRHFKDNENAFRQLKAELKLPDLGKNTFAVTTGSGGLHIYFKKPKDFPVRKHLKEYPGIDFLSEGHQVVGAGSIHPNTGNQYAIKRLSPDTVTQAPQILLNRIKKAPESYYDGLGEFSDDPVTQARFKTYIDTSEGAIEGQHGDETTYKCACVGRDYGLSINVCFMLMWEHFNPKCQPPWEYNELFFKVKNAYQYGASQAGSRSPRADFKPVEIPEEEIKWDVDANEFVKKTLRNTVNMFMIKELNLDNMLAFNQFTKDIVFLRRAPWHGPTHVSHIWSDEDSIKCKYYLSQMKSFEINTNLIDEAIVIVSADKAFHPIKEYFATLKWDGKPRLDRWLITYAGCEDSEYVRAVGRKTLVAAVARIFEPGCKFDFMLIMEGEQGTGKTTLCQILGGEFYGDITIDPTNKDTVGAMRGKWIIEVSEMECATRHETTALKAFISRQVDRVRLPYGRHTKEFHRQCILVGTTNPEADWGYLKDPTGNRRFWPVETTIINYELLRHERDQLWAEAVVSYQQGEKLYLEDKRSIEIAEVEQKRRQPKDPWLEVVRDWLDSDEFGRKRLAVRSLEIYTQCLGGRDRQFDRLSQKRISQIMRHELGWTPGLIYEADSGKQSRGYFRDLTKEEF